MPAALVERRPATLHGRPSITVDNRALRDAQRRMALATVLIPFLGTVAITRTATPGMTPTRLTPGNSRVGTKVCRPCRGCGIRISAG